MRIRFTDVAESELNEAVAHDNDAEDGLGRYAHAPRAPKLAFAPSLNVTSAFQGRASSRVGNLHQANPLPFEVNTSLECRITTVLFANDYTLLHDRVDIAEVRP